MKKLLAGSLSAAMLLFSASAAFAEAEAEVETGAQPKEIEIAATISAEGQQATGTIHVLTDADNDASLSFSAAVPSGEGEPATLAAEDILRYIGEDLYINVDAVKDVYQMVTGDASIASMLPMIGITESWVKVPKLELVLNEEAMAALSNLSVPELSEEFTASLMAIAEPIQVTETETSWIIPVNNDTLIGIADKVDEFLANNKEEITGLFSNTINPVDFLKIVDVKATFADYIDAFAEGRVSVTGEDQAAVTEEIYAMIDGAYDMIEQQIAASLPFGDMGALVAQYLEQIPDFSDMLNSVFEGITIEGQFEIAKDYSLIDGAVDFIKTDENGETETVNMTLHSEKTETGVSSVFTATNGEEVISSTFNAGMTETGFAAVLSCMNNDVEMFGASLNVAPEENGVVGSLVVTQAQAEMAAFNFTVGQNEAGYAGNCALTVQGQEIMTGAGSLTQGESAAAAALNININVDEQPVVIDVTAEVPYTLDAFNANMNISAEGQTVGLGLVGTVTDAPADTAIDAPESFILFRDVVKNVSALYYSMQAAAQQQEETGAGE